MLDVFRDIFSCERFYVNRDLIMVFLSLTILDCNSHDVKCFYVLYVMIQGDFT